MQPLTAWAAAGELGLGLLTRPYEPSRCELFTPVPLYCLPHFSEVLPRFYGLLV